MKKKIPQNNSKTKIHNSSPLIDLLIKKPHFFSQTVSTYYPFDEEELLQVEDYLDWELLSRNEYIHFTSSLISRFKNRWFWADFVTNKSIYWTIEMIGEYKSFLSRPNHILGNPMSSLCRSANVEWGVELLDKFKEIIDWQALSRNQKLSWGEDLIKRFKDKWDWKVLCVDGEFWTSGLIISLQDELDHNMERWNYLISNSHVEWTMEFILSFKEKWFAELPHRLHDEYDFYKNPKIPWDENFIEIFEKSLNWHKLSESEYLPWSEELIKKYTNKWDWKSLVLNPFINWDENLINKFEERVVSHDEYKSWLVRNPAVVWNENIIDKFIDVIDWSCLCESKKMKWTQEILLKYSNKIDWRRLSENQSIQWTEEMLNGFDIEIEKFFINEDNKPDWTYLPLKRCIEKLRWANHSSRTDIALNYELINKHKDDIDWGALSNNSAVPWELTFIKEFSSKMIGWQKIDEIGWSPQNKYSCLFGSAIKTDINYYNFLITDFPDIELLVPRHDMWIKYFQPFFNKIILLEVFNTLVKNNEAPIFPSEKKVAHLEEENKAEYENEMRRSNYMSKRELADLLGYDEDDIDDISEDDIWERTGH